jgi:hypothetical protein
MLFIGSLGFFLFLMLLFVKLVPMISMSELREQHHEEWSGEEKPPKSEEPLVTEPALAPHELHGISGEFSDVKTLVEAARRLRSEGFRAVEGYAPYAVKGLAEALGHKTRIAAVMFLGACTGGFGAWLLMYWTSTVDYPWNIGGRPTNSLPSFVPIVFEMSILFAALFGMAAFFVRCGFPRPYHAIMNVKGFERVARDRFLLCVESQDAAFEPRRVRELFTSLGAVHVQEVPR